MSSSRHDQPAGDRPHERPLEPPASADRPPRGNDPDRARAFAVEAARTLADDKCEEVVALDVRGLSMVTDFLVIASGTSGRQMASAIKHVEEVGEQMGFARYGKSTGDSTGWLLCDFVDVVVHVFEPNVRAHYDLEMMWGDAEELDWRSRKPRQ